MSSCTRAARTTTYFTFSRFWGNSEKPVYPSPNNWPPRLNRKANTWNTESAGGYLITKEKGRTSTQISTTLNKVTGVCILRSSWLLQTLHTLRFLSLSPFLRSTKEGSGQEGETDRRNRMCVPAIKNLSYQLPCPPQPKLGAVLH